MTLSEEQQFEQELAEAVSYTHLDVYKRQLQILFTAWYIA